MSGVPLGTPKMRNTSSDQVSWFCATSRCQLPMCAISCALFRLASLSRSASSACLCSVTSWTVPRTSTTRPPASRSASPRLVTDRSRAIGANHLQLELERRPRLDGPFHRGGQPREAFRRVETGVLLEARRRQLRIAAGNAIQPFRPRDGVGRGIPPPTAHARQTLRLSQLLLASMQRPFRVPAFRVAAIDALAAPDRQTASSVIIATIITVISLHSENRPAE